MTLKAIARECVAKLLSWMDAVGKDYIKKRADGKQGEESLCPFDGQRDGRSRYKSAPGIRADDLMFRPSNGACLGSRQASCLSQNAPPQAEEPMQGKVVFGKTRRGFKMTGRS
jgi:hypothetical protein